MQMSPQFSFSLASTALFWERRSMLEACVSLAVRLLAARFLLQHEGVARNSPWRCAGCKPNAVLMVSSGCLDRWKLVAI